MMSEHHEIEYLRGLFLKQTEQFRNFVRGDDRQARFGMTRSLPDNGKNWFIWFKPSHWGFASAAGIHWALISTQHLKRPSGKIHIALGVEGLREDIFAEEFKEQVAMDANAEGVVPAGFRLFGQYTKQKKLLVSPSIPLDESSAIKTYSLYKETKRFNMVVSRTIRKFDAANYFEQPLRYQ